MAFDILFNNPMHEAKLLELLISDVQKNYDQNQNTFFFFKLKHLGGKKSEIVWQKTFSNRKDFGDYYYDTKFMRACIMLKFDKGRFEVLCLGYYYTDRFEIWPDKTLKHCPMETEPDDTDKVPMPPRELIERGFGEIADALSTSSSKIPM